MLFDDAYLFLWNYLFRWNTIDVYGVFLWQLPRELCSAFSGI